MSDLISRQAAIDALNRVYKIYKDSPSAYDWGYTDGINYAISKLSEMKSVDLEKDKGRWIPCDERLPDKHGRYLIAVNSGEGLFISVDDYFDNGWDDYVFQDDVKAWMELPEPYEEPTAQTCNAQIIQDLREDIRGINKDIKAMVKAIEGIINTLEMSKQ